MTKTAKEIIRQAKFLSQSDNSDFMDFFVSNNLLNTLYEQVYQDIVTHTKNYIKTVDFDNEVCLPEDCYAIHSVESVTGYVYDRAPEHQNVSGCYTIENNVLKAPGSSNVLKYYPIPQTITCPDDLSEINLVDFAKSIQLRDDFFIYEDSDGLQHTYDLNSGEITDVSQLRTEDENMYCGYSVIVGYEVERPKVINSVIINNEECISYLAREGLNIKKIVSQGNIMFVIYDDDSIYLFADYCLMPWNIEEYKGRETKGDILAVYPNQNTGKGVIWKNKEDGKTYWASFVPDTVLDFPTNIFYEVIEVRLALLLSSLLGMTNDYLQNSYSEKIEQQYYDCLKRDDYSPTRIRNVNARKW